MKNWFQPIPINVFAAAQILLDNLTKEDLNHLKVYGSIDFHHTLGQRIRNEWLWDENSPLHQYFWNNYKIWHGDDMSSVILNYSRSLIANEGYDFPKAAEHYQQYWLKVMGLKPGTRPEKEKV